MFYDFLPPLATFSRFQLLSNRNAHAARENSQVHARTIKIACVRDLANIPHCFIDADMWLFLVDPRRDGGDETKVKEDGPEHSCLYSIGKSEAVAVQ